MKLQVPNGMFVTQKHNLLVILQNETNVLFTFFHCNYKTLLYSTHENKDFNGPSRKKNPASKCKYPLNAISQLLHIKKEAGIDVLHQGDINPLCIRFSSGMKGDLFTGALYNGYSPPGGFGWDQFDSTDPIMV